MNRPLGKRLSGVPTVAWSTMRKIDQHNQQLGPRLCDRLWAPLDFPDSVLITQTIRFVARQPLGKALPPLWAQVAPLAAVDPEHPAVPSVMWVWDL